MRCRISSRPPTRSRVLITDGHSVVAERVRVLLNKAFDVAKNVGDGPLLLDEAPKLKPDVIILDVTVPLLNGLNAYRATEVAPPDAKFVFLTMNEIQILTPRR